MPEAKKVKKFRIYILVGVLLALVAVTYWLLTRDETTSKAQFSGLSFAIPASAQPDSIALAHRGQLNFLLLENQNFYFNGSYRAKPALQEAFLAILKQMEVKRPVSKKVHANLLTAIDSAGVQVKVYEQGVLLKHFELWGDRSKEATYIKEPGKDSIYLVTIPGHSVYVADIFFYEANQWRNNALFASTWRSLNQLSVTFPKTPEQDFSVEFGEDFFHIPGLEAFDTLVLLDYLETFSNITITRYLPEQQKVLDSLLNIEPALTVKIDDLDTANANVLHFYPGETEQHKNQVLVIGKDREPGIIPVENFKEIARGEAHFSYTGTKK